MLAGQCSNGGLPHAGKLEHLRALLHCDLSLGELVTGVLQATGGDDAFFEKILVALGFFGGQLKLRSQLHVITLPFKQLRAMQPRQRLHSLDVLEAVDKHRLHDTGGWRTDNLDAVWRIDDATSQSDTHAGSAGWFDGGKYDAGFGELIWRDADRTGRLRLCR